MTALSSKHHHVQRVQRLLRKRRLRDEQGVAVIEGAQLIHEALAAGVVPEAVFAAPGAPESLLRKVLDAGGRVHHLAPGVIERISDTVTPQPVLAIVARPVSGLERLDEIEVLNSVIVGVDVRDPGNAGTLIRSAEAAGIGAVVLCDGSVDLYNPKTLRASAGALFHVPVINGGAVSETLERCRQRGLRCLGTVAHGGQAPETVNLSAPVALVVGNEAHGLPDEVLKGLDGLITIPISGRSESLNVGMATAVLSFEVARQRRGTT